MLQPALLIRTYLIKVPVETSQQTTKKYRHLLAQNELCYPVEKLEELLLPESHYLKKVHLFVFVRHEETVLIRIRSSANARQNQLLSSGIFVLLK